MKKEVKKIEVCCGSDCMIAGAHAIVGVLEEKYADTETAIGICGCVDLCEKAVNVIVDDNRIFSYSTPDNVISQIENSQGEPYQKFTQEKFDLNDDFLGDL